MSNKTNSELVSKNKNPGVMREIIGRELHPLKPLEIIKEDEPSPSIFYFTYPTLEIDVYPNHLIDDVWNFIGRGLHLSDCNESDEIDFLPFPDYFYFDHKKVEFVDRRLTIRFTLKESKLHDKGVWTFCKDLPIVYARGVKKHIDIEVRLLSEKACDVTIHFKVRETLKDKEDPNCYCLLGFLLRCQYHDKDITTIFSSQDPKIGLGGVDA